MWSLTHEMRISLILPLIVLLVAWRPMLVSALSLAVSVIALLAQRHVTPLAAEWLGTAHYAFLFIFGAVLARFHQPLRDAISAAPTWVRWAAWAAAALLLFVPVAVGGSVSEYAMSAGAILAVALSFADAGAVRVLEHRPLRYVGRISYSLYLIHLPVLLTVMHLGVGRLPAPLLVLIGLSLTAICADLMNRFIERPAQRLGRVLAASL
jgi:peptidoglycan/LPS O-acetylase OafA/YrhL